MMLRKKNFSLWVPLALLAAQFTVLHVAAQAPDVSAAIRAAGDAAIDAVKQDNSDALEARFDARMKQAMPHEKFGSVMKDVKRQLGALKGCAAPISQLQGGITVLDYSCEFDVAKFNIRLAYNADTTIAGLFFLPPKP